MIDPSGLRVLVVEDEGTVALMIEDMLQDLGCEIAASIARFADACRVAGTLEVDLALLDVNLAGQQVFPVAEILQARQIPIVFSTGYGSSGLPSEFSEFPVLGKPFSMEQLRQAIALAVAQ
jgi:CheY-like chemotaxis protein